MPSSVSIFQQILQSFPRGEIVRCRNPENVEMLLEKIMEGTEKSLQVITDFDFTLTRHHLNGKKCQSSYGVLDHSPLLPDEFKTINLALYDKYHPIEICHELTTAEKIPLMMEWYDETHKSLVAHGKVTRSLIQVITNGSEAILRDNAVHLLQILNEVEVPVLIFSAGIGDVLQAIIQGQDALLPNIKIVSNWMEFDDESGDLTGFKEPIIHTFNKNESVLGTENSYFADLSHRTNAILLGDSIGDVGMADGMPNAGNILKIGFLNMNIEERMESFLDVFDIVLVDDQSMDFVNLLVKIVLKHTPTATST